ncbi:transcriptional regulator, LysR family [Burkholderia sp. D7]|nr:transcriptional regulator, LysR family [Burkholderia sp. D7]
MPTGLPSLNLLRAFEATARHLSFTRAGIELSLTQTAISHRIRELEELLSVQLFVRLQNGISLTAEGRGYLEAVRPALSQIAAATYSVSSARDDVLNVVCLSAFAISRLLPALPRFQALHPDFRLRITPSAVAERGILKDFDVAITYGLDDWPDLHAQRISTEEIFPVCVPALLANGSPLRCPSDITQYPIIRTVSPIITDEWPAWLQFAGVNSTDFSSELYCEGLYFSMSATLAGLGIGLGRTSLVADDLRTGRLVMPFDSRMPSDSAYFVVSRTDRSALPKVKAFREWLLEDLIEPTPGTLC